MVSLARGFGRIWHQLEDAMPNETKSQRLTRQMKKDAERQQRRRASMAEKKKPETHAVDRALSEALAYVVVCSHVEGKAREDVEVSFLAVLKTAARILAARGRYDAAEASKAVFARTRSRKPMHWTLADPKRPEA
jgi:hypothetical protein